MRQSPALKSGRCREVFVFPAMVGPVTRPDMNSVDDVTKKAIRLNKKRLILVENLQKEVLELRRLKSLTPRSGRLPAVDSRTHVEREQDLAD